MIYIIDNFLDEKLLNVINNDASDFKEFKTPGKSFWVKTPSEEFINYVLNKLSIIENSDLENILAFFREAKQNQDNDWRIHNDSIINNKKPDRAIVLYLSEDNLNGINGTAFWSHKKLGDTFNYDNIDKFNDVLINDSDDISKWDLKSIIGHKNNRLLSYPCNYFHSKYPSEFIESRVVFVMFYKIKTKNE